MNLTLLIDWSIPTGLAEIYSESSDCEFVGNKEGALTVEEAYASLQKYVNTKTYGNFERLGIMKIFHNSVLVGFSMPRELKDKECNVFKLVEGITYYRIGTVYIAKAHRGKGIMSNVIKEFVKKYTNVIWTHNEQNILSRKAALSGGLKYSHDIYVGDNRTWTFSPNPNQIRVDIVYKSEVK